MRCWAEINLENLRKNVIELEKITAKKNIMTVVKANAYGHGMIEIFVLNRIHQYDFFQRKSEQMRP